MKNNLKILHIWNTASVPVTLAKYQRKLGHQADVIMREIYTSFRGDELLEGAMVINGSARKFALACLKTARKYDIIHAHAFPFTDKYIRRILRWKKYVYHMHGSRIRNQWSVKKKKWEKANAIIVSTPELLEGAPPHARYIPNPIDTELFTRRNPFKPKTALYILTKEAMRSVIPFIQDTCKEMDLALTIMEREKVSINLKSFPQFLESFEYFFDLKLIDYVTPDRKVVTIEKLNDAWSLTGLQALALGLKVFHDGKIHSGFPKESDAWDITHRVLEVYKEVLDK